MDPVCGDGVCETPFEYASFGRFGCRADCGELAEVQNLTTLQINLYYDFDHPTTSIASSVCCCYTPYVLFASVSSSHMLCWHAAAFVTAACTLVSVLWLWHAHQAFMLMYRSFVSTYVFSSFVWSNKQKHASEAIVCSVADGQYDLLMPSSMTDTNHIQILAPHIPCPADTNGSGCVESVPCVWCGFWFCLLLCR